MPRSLAASTRPWPAMIRLLSSIRTGLQKPNFLMLFAICRTCWGECVLALLGYGCSSRTGVSAIFIGTACAQRRRPTFSGAEIARHSPMHMAELGQRAYDETRGF